jgi:lysophospholipase L1-like esterase
MTPDDEADIAAEIDRAHALAEGGAHGAAALAFATARAMVTSLADPERLATRINNHWTPLTRERELYRSIVAERRTTGRPLVVFSDSLGLPRPDAKSGPHQGADGTYPFMLVDRLSGHAVNSLSQRYFTTQHVIDLLEADPGLGVDSDVFVHIGLNDATWRMFSEPDRLGLDLLTPAVKDRIVGFAQKYRTLIIRELPEYHYVSPDQFRTNLDIFLEMLSGRGARVALATVILPPVRFWSFTPGLQRNFARYNLILMDAAHRGGASLIDLDRLVWDKQHDGVLLSDGMHLSETGHQLVAEQVASLFS